MAFNFLFPLRVLQAIFSFLVMALTAAVVNRGKHSTLSFVLFTSVWSLLVLIYLVLAPTRFPDAAHKFAILGVEFVTMVFWFGGFIAFADLMSPAPRYTNEITRVAQAAVAFSAFAWVCFLATTVIAGLHVWRTRNTNETRPAPEMREEVV